MNSSDIGFSEGAGGTRTFQGSVGLTRSPGGVVQVAAAFGYRFGFLPNLGGFAIVQGQTGPWNGLYQGFLVNGPMLQMVPNKGGTWYNVAYVSRLIADGIIPPNSLSSGDYPTSYSQAVNGASPNFVNSGPISSDLPLVNYLVQGLAFVSGGYDFGPCPDGYVPFNENAVFYGADYCDNGSTVTTQFTDILEPGIYEIDFSGYYAGSGSTSGQVEVSADRTLLSSMHSGSADSQWSPQTVIFTAKNEFRINVKQTGMTIDFSGVQYITLPPANAGGGVDWTPTPGSGLPAQGSATAAYYDSTPPLLVPDYLNYRARPRVLMTVTPSPAGVIMSVNGYMLQRTDVSANYNMPLGGGLNVPANLVVCNRGNITVKLPGGANEQTVKVAAQGGDVTVTDLNNTTLAVIHNGNIGTFSTLNSPWTFQGQTSVTFIGQ